MPQAVRHHFKKFSPPPTPWKMFGEGIPQFSPVQSQFTLLRIQCSTDTALRKMAVRKVLGEELQRAAGRPVRWEETRKGPKISASILGPQTHVSISYTAAEVWLALGWEGPIGIDAVALEHVSDWEEVASVYLSEQAMERLRQSFIPALKFTEEWAAFEARLKWGGLSLKEGIQAPDAQIYAATFDSTAVAVAV